MHGRKTTKQKRGKAPVSDLADGASQYNDPLGGPLALPLPAFIRSQPDGVLLAIKLQPRASRDEIGEPLGDELRLKVTAPPVDAAANEALVRFLATTLEYPRSKVELVRGHTSRHKLIKIYGVTAGSLLAALAKARSA